jgi:hypothetical protein
MLLYTCTHVRTDLCTATSQAAGFTTLPKRVIQGVSARCESPAELYASLAACAVDGTASQQCRRVAGYSNCRDNAQNAVLTSQQWLLMHGLQHRIQCKKLQTMQILVQQLRYDTGVSCVNAHAADIQQHTTTYYVVVGYDMGCCRKRVVQAKTPICTGCHALLQTPQHQPHVRPAVVLPSHQQVRPQCQTSCM